MKKNLNKAAKKPEQDIQKKQQSYGVSAAPTSKDMPLQQPKQASKKGKKDEKDFNKW